MLIRADAFVFRPAARLLIGGRLRLHQGGEKADAQAGGEVPGREAPAAIGSHHRTRCGVHRKIVLVNAALKYVVIEGVIGRLPPTETALNVYRDGQKVGVVTVSNQARGANFAADLTQGEARLGDTVRSD